MNRYIPGHFRAITFWLAVLLAVSFYISSGKLSSVFGAVMVVVGIFFADQATHLAQADHSAPPPTAIERWMQTYRWFFVVFGTLIAILGGLLTLA